MIESPINATRCTPIAANGGRWRAANTAGHETPGFVGPARRQVRSHNT